MSFLSTVRLAALAGAWLCVAGAAQATYTTPPAPPPSGTTLTEVGSKSESHKISLTGGSSYWYDTLGASKYSNGSSSFWVYCIDPKTPVYLNQSYTTTSLENFMSGGRYGAQFNQTAYKNIEGYGYNNQNTSTVLNNLLNLYSHAYYDSLSSSTKAAAFNYAIWEVMGESSYSSTSGGARAGEAGSAWRQQVDAYLSALSTNSWGSVNGVNLSSTTNFVYTVYLTAAQGASQSFLCVTPGGGGAGCGLPGGGGGGQVPEPGSLALAGVALAGLAGLRRRRQTDR